MKVSWQDVRMELYDIFIVLVFDIAFIHMEQCNIEISPSEKTHHLFRKSPSSIGCLVDSVICDLS